MPTELDIQRATTAVNIPGDDQFRLWVKAALVGKSSDFTLAIRIVDEQEGQHLNRQYRNKDYATNVLSFPAELPESLPAEIRLPQLGDLVICAPVVAREAMERHRPETDHWAHLSIHGVLHLLGYNHQIPDEALVMESLETEILAGLGISDPYQDLS
ncbi:rRNA maturation RNase YbeY [Pseudomonadota bacterium]